MNLRLADRICSFLFMFAHQLRWLAKGEIHIEAIESCGPVVNGAHLGISFIRRRCVTCGYEPDAKESK